MNGVAELISGSLLYFRRWRLLRDCRQGLESKLTLSCPLPRGSRDWYFQNPYAARPDVVYASLG
jgi:hypothetical protein